MNTKDDDPNDILLCVEQHVKFFRRNMEMEHPITKLRANPNLHIRTLGMQSVTIGPAMNVPAAPRGFMLRLEQSNLTSNLLAQTVHDVHESLFTEALQLAISRSLPAPVVETQISGTLIALSQSNMSKGGGRLNFLQRYKKK
jgi:hypothetical protein